MNVFLILFYILCFFTARVAAIGTKLTSKTTNKTNNTSTKQKVTANKRPTATKSNVKKNATKTNVSSKTIATNINGNATAKESKESRETNTTPSILERFSKKDQKLLLKYPDPARPKRPAPPTHYFRIDKENESESIRYSVYELASMWNELDEKTKNYYKLMFQNASKKYQNAMKEYKTIEETSIQEWLQTIKELHEQRPPMSGYLGFVKENKAMFTNTNGNNQFGKVAKVECKILNVIYC